jgi:hypothetical protein
MNTKGKQPYRQKTTAQRNLPRQKLTSYPLDLRFIPQEKLSVTPTNDRNFLNMHFILVNPILSVKLMLPHLHLLNAELE